MRLPRYLPLIFILLLAFAVRFIGLSSLPAGLHWDEQDTGYQAYSLLKTGRDYFGNPLPLFLHSIADYRTPVFIYANVVPISIFGLTSFSVRISSVIFGVLSVILIYVLARRVIHYQPASWLAALTLALSPWHILYSRQSVECNVMLVMLLTAVCAFYAGLKRPRWLIVSGLLFGLSVASYSPAKFFAPLLMLFLVFLYRKIIFRQPIKTLILSVLLFSILSVPIIADGIWGNSGLRFHDVSIFTDPTTKSEVDSLRQYHQLSSGIPRKVGLSPRLIDKLAANKFTFLGNRFVSGYLDVYSTQYLFTKGDQEIRHSPSKDGIGQLQLIEIIPFLLGLFALSRRDLLTRRSALVLGFWLLIGPIPSALTRGGGAHAARTFLMLPAFTLLISLGVSYLATLKRFLPILYLGALVASSFIILNYFFADYRFESLKPFQWGFDQAVRTAVSQSPSYDRVILDMHSDSAFMAFLFSTQFDPKTFQSMNPLPVVQIYPGSEGNIFGNIVTLFPGTRIWQNIYTSNDFTGRNLLIVTADQPLLESFPKLQTINYPDGNPAFYVINLSK
jgi:4-amino-4-deoxy-L-arabinose transferase-like glycosyltransferase